MELDAKYLQSIINCIPCGILVVDTNCTVIAVNTAYENIFAATHENIVGTNFIEFKPDSLFPKVIRTGKPITRVIYHNQSCFHNFDGMGLSITLFPIFDDNGTIIGAGSLYQDVRGHIESTRQYEQIVKRYSNVLRTQHQAQRTIDDILGDSPSIYRVKQNIYRAAASSSSVLLRGASGTGKEMFASALHMASPIANQPFVIVNCPSLPESLAESELFGYENGAFSGALKGGKLGFFEIADGGTVFLDEIGDLSLSLQAKILRVLETGDFCRVGGTKPVHVKFRLVSATNRNLEKMILNGKFREDLYFRLASITIDIPPLKERGTDILTLANYFINQESESKRVLSPEVEEILLKYPWPGNVRQLKNVISNMLYFTDELVLRPEHLPRNLQTSFQTNFSASTYHTQVGEPRESTASYRNFGRSQKKADEIYGMLEKYGYSLKAKKQIANELGISLSTLYNRLREFGIPSK